MAQPFCKVCKDAGKSSSVFNSHFTRDRQGNTICPTLLNQECRWCHEKGHTVKYCQKLAEKNAHEQHPSPHIYNRRVQEQSQQKQSQQKQSQQKQSQPHGRFALLMDDDEPASAGAEKKAPAEDFPELTGNWARVAAATSQPAKPTFASMVAKPVPQPQLQPKVELRTQLEAAGFKFIEAKKPAQSRLPSSEEIAAVMKRSPVFHKCWADAYESEDDEEVSQYEKDVAAIERFTDRCRD